MGDFGNITNLLDLSIQSNDALTNLSGLENLLDSYAVVITGNDALNSLDGLVSLGRANGLFIEGNQSLTNLSGLENISFVQAGTDIIDNASLNDISALSNTHLGEYINISNNPVLSVCNIASVCDHLNEGRDAFINYNTGECTYAELVYVNCGSAFPTCPLDGDVLLRTQEDVDSFAVRFPSCTTLKSLRIINWSSLPPTNNLSPLQQIETIEEALIITNNNITNLQGLENLTSAGSLNIRENDVLTDLSALENLNSVEGLYISYNEMLSNLNGLGNINHNLIQFISIENNPNLSVCYVESVCGYLQNDGGNSIENNTSGCNSEEEVEASCTALPVELTQFNAEAQRNSILLTWQTATETNNQGFEIQRSKDGITWEKIGYQQGAINSNTTQDYRHNDTQPLSGINYYRLKQIDVAGDFIYSDVVNVWYENGGFGVFPVPAKDEITLQIESPEAAVEIRISNIIGEVIHTQDLQLSEGVNQLTFDISEYANGIYFLTINNGDKNGTQRFVKH